MKHRIEWMIAFWGIMLLSIWNRNLNKEKIQQSIANEVIRFHVIANSDSIQDQNIKLKVKEEIIEEIQSNLKEVNTVEQARVVLLEHITWIEKKANQILQEKGMKYQAKVSLGQRRFPIKLYGDMTFPAGTYEALTVELGKGNGKNWWCVMFPSLCIVDGTYQVVPEKSKNQLKKVLSVEEYDSLLHSSNRVHIKFKIAELWKRWFED